MNPDVRTAAMAEGMRAANNTRIKKRGSGIGMVASEWYRLAEAAFDALGIEAQQLIPLGEDGDGLRWAALRGESQPLVFRVAALEGPPE